MDEHKHNWDESYLNKDNFVFYPHEEVIRFVSKYIRKRVGLEAFHDVVPGVVGSRILDLGCGIGRHVMYCHDMGLQAYGVDLSSVAIQVAREWGERSGLPNPEERLQQGDIRELSWKK